MKRYILLALLMLAIDFGTDLLMDYREWENRIELQWGQP
jgi:hypothetical protein